MWTETEFWAWTGGEAHQNNNKATTYIRGWLTAPMKINYMRAWLNVYKCEAGGERETLLLYWIRFWEIQLVFVFFWNQNVPVRRLASAEIFELNDWTRSHLGSQRVDISRCKQRAFYEVLNSESLHESCRAESSLKIANKFQFHVHGQRHIIGYIIVISSTQRR